MKNYILMYLLWLVMAIFIQACASLGVQKPLVYNVQVGSFSNVENAGQLVDSLNQKGLDAFLFKEDNMYKVRFGNYKNFDHAKTQAQIYKEQGLIGEFFVLSPQKYAHKNDTKYKKSKNIRDDIVESAHQYLGVPYKWGGTSESGFDCSGLTHSVYRLNGISLPRSSYEQYNEGDSISKSKLKKGDLVFFITNRGKRVNHVGIYIGNDEFIHAPSKGKVVSKARLDSTYWTKAYKGARSYF
ncbi:NlpC/P60 family protein [Helicobacter sp. MIT 21-1697]|uniref:NlpC/P60 family protein n=1 Tax=Helicobacter sp. MIT 21-1697 TaxID=2993733 RepID=UPI00224B673E|nr:NlpC/P60 family protein [Helicobacter sp. MIT 21-1697]MCX2716614.1 NlpC/P60 family protein [Helicobacter sp. MIT 21-1697]